MFVYPVPHLVFSPFLLTDGMLKDFTALLWVYQKLVRFQTIFRNKMGRMPGTSNKNSTSKLADFCSIEVKFKKRYFWPSFPPLAIQWQNFGFWDFLGLKFQQWSNLWLMLPPIFKFWVYTWRYRLSSFNTHLFSKCSKLGWVTIVAVTETPCR